MSRTLGWIARRPLPPEIARGNGLVFPATDWSFGAGSIEAASRAAEAASWSAIVGAGLNLGSTDAIDFDAVARVGALADAVSAAWIGDDIAWNGVDDRVWRVPLPLPRTLAVATHVAERLRVVRDVLGRELLLTNIGRAGRFPAPAELGEVDFVLAAVEAAGCGLVLDLVALAQTAASDGVAVSDLALRLPTGAVRGLVLRGEPGEPGLDAAEWRAFLVEASRRFSDVPLLVEPLGLAAWPEPLTAHNGP